MDINILILGGGVGGLVTANLLVKEVRRKGVKARIKLIDEVEGLRERRGLRAHGFCTPESAVRLAAALDAFDGGDLVVDVAEMPIKCSVAPLEFALLADEYLTRRGIRGRTRLTVVTPLKGAFTKPVCNDMRSHLLADRGIRVVPNAPLASASDKAVPTKSSASQGGAWAR